MKDDESDNGMFRKLFLQLIERTDNEKLESIIDNAQESIIIAQNGYLKFFNRTFVDMIGRSKEEIETTLFLDMIHPDDRNMILDRHKRRISGEEVENNYTFRVLDSRGSTRWVRIVAIGIKWDGEPATLNLINEITEEVESKDLYKKVLDNAFDAIYMISGSGYEYVNYRFEEMTGYTAAELTSEDFDYNVLLTDNTRELMRNRYQARKRGESISPQYQTQVVRKDGFIIDVEVTTVPIPDMKRVLVLGIMRDITQRKKAENALIREKQYYNSFLESLEDWAWQIDMDGVHIYSNSAVKKILGYEPKEILGKKDWELWPAESDTKELRENFFLRLNAGKPWRGIKGAYTSKEGKTVITESTGVPIFDRNSVLVGYRGVDRDITERYRSEKHTREFMEELKEQVDMRTKELFELNRDLEREMEEKEKLQVEMIRAAKMDSLGVLAGGIAHDFNNLLTGIIGNLSLAEAKNDDPEWILERVKDALDASRRARGLTKQLLTFSKGGAPVLEPTSLEELIEETCRFALSGSNVKVDLDIQDDLWPVEADAGQIGQVIHNLVLNASQAMPEGGFIWIKAKNRHLMEEDGVPLLSGKYVRIDVEDEGTGIPKEDLDRIFDPYYTTKKRGSGLGLASSFSIIKKHNGHMTARSRLGEGTKFIIHLPASERESKKKLLDGEDIKTFEGSVLVMDHDEVVLNVMRNMLNTLGFRVHATRDAFGARSLYQRAMQEDERFRAAFLELTVPGGAGGLRAAEEIVGSDPNAVLFAMTAGNERLEDMNGEGSPFRAILRKPIRLSDISRTFNKHLDD